MKESNTNTLLIPRVKNSWVWEVKFEAFKLMPVIQKHYEEVSGGELLCGGWLIRTDPIRSDIHVPFLPTTKPTKTLGSHDSMSLLSLTHTFTLYHTCLIPTNFNHFYLLQESMSIPCAIIVFEKKNLVPCSFQIETNFP